ncbi:acetyltransferase (GNAT family) [Aliarcobacter faecis]|uniref:GNAT family N-acetyltransferase n=1 Tax=Aliarcobacter faecis TaxID=1564138 RepID=UPI00047EE077|nr:GNAT family N-acetyltransferase [Aliarcobacter faecis]QKF73472.1 acetyltransferase (GNAT family) [Aliarcobacter faecis]
MIISFDELKVKLFEFRKNHKEIISNYLSQNILGKKIILIENANGLLFFVYDQEYDIYKSYFMVNGFYSLELLLIKANWNKNSSLEWIYKDKIDIELKKTIDKYGFIEYTRLSKMSFMNDDYIIDIENEELNIKYCNISDAKSLKLIFLHKFNKYSENLPSNIDIEKAIKTQSIIKILDKNSIVCFLWFDSKKVVTELRYLFVDENYRGQGLSKLLMKQYLYLTKQIKKKQLWVLENNEIAIKLYKSFGYSFEDLKDIIFKKEVENEK